ncbi:hypothetical protein BC939DRAFT_496147 [Gamsiella multidivaricata]|uniref:uncharacterized protein n=1 Tax=Gamsiella multidivaricata TaxID=101098 RepID=UPI0022209BFA|nr:uncharacterized protein BC939DRAFT_496147 [Gamsiella multidivaricata]KAG0369054.1 hypothetical protein BGZ54_000480 [Gamsiella multidivaricata]KAI7818171.1 hypothetical protein BC939DRAFT_496147 [Gamsiella multidivaricata]
MASSSATGSNAPSGKPAGFMSEYMSGLSQSQDLNSFLQKNQPAYDPNSHSQNTSSFSSEGAAATPSTGTTHTSASPKDTNTSQGSSSTPSEESTAQKAFSPKSPIGSHPMPNAHAIHQKHAIQNAALDNCADINMELTDCLLGRSGTWWDRASMCMKAKEQLQKCLRLNKQLLQERGFADEGNTLEQDRAILDYADDHAQRAMKEDSEA